MRARPRDQRGMTLIETLLAVTISGLLMVPMLGWASVAFRQQVEVSERNVDGASLGLLRTYFVRDVAGAQDAAVDGDGLDECRPADAAVRTGSRTVLALGAGERRVAYVEAAGRDGGRSLWRLECATAGAHADGVHRARRADQHRWHRCDVPAGRRRCRQVSLRVTTTDLEQSVMTASLRASRITAADLAPPEVVVSAEPTRGPRALEVRFSSSGSTDPFGGELSYEWDFGDGATSTEADPRHRYERLGRYTATLTVTNERGGSASASVEIEVLDNPPVAAIAAPEPGTTVGRGEIVEFSPDGSNDDLDAPWGGRIVSYEWDLGDGTTSSERSPLHGYDRLSPEGGFPVRLTVTDDAGGTATAETTVVVANREPLVELTADPTAGRAPLTVAVAASVTDETTMAINPPLRYRWDFGDGRSSDAAAPAPVRYEEAGTRTITVTVTDDAGATATASVDVRVDARELPAPTGLRQTGRGREGSGRDRTRWIDVAWDRVDGASRYQVFLECDGCAETASELTDGTTTRVDGLRRQRTWYWSRVRAFDPVAAQWGPWSEGEWVRS